MRHASPYSCAVFERLKHFPFARRLFQLHALLPCPPQEPQCSAAATSAFPYNRLAHAHVCVLSAPGAAAAAGASMEMLSLL